MTVHGGRDEPDPERRRAEHAAGPAACVRVLVVDDHEILAQGIERLLRDSPGVEVVGTAATARAAVAAAAELAPDVVLMDYHLPDGDGVRAAAQIRSDSPTSKVIILSGSASATAVLAARRAGCAGYLDKSIAAGELLATLLHVARGGEAFEALGEVPTGDALVVHYQPIVDLDRAQLWGVEALVRWAHPGRGLLGPSEFLDRVEGTELIADVDLTVLAVACAELTRLHPITRGPPLTLCVNLSSWLISAPDFVERVRAVVQGTGLEASIVLEITERTMIDITPAVVAELAVLRSDGMRVALDDFGTGHSNLDYLSRLPVDVVKIDKTFVDDLPDSARARVLAQSIATLASDVGATAIAEGIEDERQLEYLRDLGSMLGQGYHLWRPMPAVALESLVARGPSPDG